MFPETYPWMVNTDNDLVFAVLYRPRIIPQKWLSKLEFPGHLSVC